MKRIDGAFLSLWTRRILVYLAGLFCMALGVVFSARSSLGVSPVGSLANVLYQIALREDLPDYVNLGNCTTAVYCLYLLAELLILRRDFKLSMLLQLAASLLFGQLVNLAYQLLFFLPVPPNYAVQLAYLLCSVPLVAFGVMLYLSPKLLPTPGEGMSLAISQKTGLSLGSAKTVFDCSLVLISAAVSLLWFHGLEGVREGTVICALTVGFVIRQFQKLCQKPLLRFVEREDRVERAVLAATEGYAPDASARPRIIITIGREYGAGGYEIGQLLAKKLGSTVDDKQLNVMAAERSGLSLAKIEELEKHMERELVYDFRAGAYEMVGEGLRPEERLFVAQTEVIRRIAAGNESCVIMGRCADYILYEDPNCFRVFIHAVPAARIDRTMAKFALSREDAEREMRNTDLSRSSHYRRFTGREYGKQEYYHLGVDSSQLGTEHAADLIVDAVRLWCEVRGTHPLSALEQH